MAKLMGCVLLVGVGVVAWLVAVGGGAVLIAVAVVVAGASVVLLVSTGSGDWGSGCDMGGDFCTALVRVVCILICDPTGLVVASITVVSMAVLIVGMGIISIGRGFEYVGLVYERGVCHLGTRFWVGEK